MNDFLFASVAVICADTPKSAAEKKKQNIIFTTIPQTPLM